MIWLTWRRLRAPAAAVYALLAAAAAALLIAGRPSLVSGAALTPGDNALYFGGVITMYAVPAVIGVFWGAPLMARELEAGTHRLAWNQTVTRVRWLTVKLGLTGLAAVAASGLLSLAVTWWAEPADAASRPATFADGGAAASLDARVSPLVFGARGIVPIGYAAFAFVLGVLAGIVLRRTVLAMAVTLAVYVAVQLAVPFAVRPYIVPPVRETVAVTPANLSRLTMDDSGKLWSIEVAGPPGAWIIANETVDRSGRAITPPSWVARCVPGPGTPADEGARRQAVCIHRLGDGGYRQRIVYQPAERFWTLQWAETGCFAIFSVLLAGLCVRLLRRVS